jgi:DNA-directed RNA polymerase subunit RPC12/RpoP
MSIACRRFVLQGALFGAACVCIGARVAFVADAPPSGKYVCPPCGCAADGKEFDAPGACPECGIPLIPKPAEPKPKDGAATPPTAHGGGEGLAAQNLALKPG